MPMQESVNAAATELEDYSSLQLQVTQFQAEMDAANRRAAAEVAQVWGLHTRVLVIQSLSDTYWRTGRLALTQC